MAARNSTAKNKAAASTKAAAEAKKAEQNSATGDANQATQPEPKDAEKQQDTAPAGNEQDNAAPAENNSPGEDQGKDSEPQDNQGDNFGEQEGSKDDDAKPDGDDQGHTQGEDQGKESQAAKPEKKQDNEPAKEKPALWVRTKRRVGSRRRAGIRFSREGMGVDLESLTKDQVLAIKADPALDVEEITYQAEPEE